MKHITSVSKSVPLKAALGDNFKALMDYLWSIVVPLYDPYYSK